MGIFDNFFGNKPGKGISREQIQREREKITMSGFFKIYKRKFWKMIQLNLLSFLFYIPVLYVFVFYISPFIINNPVSGSDITSIAQMPYASVWNLINVSSAGQLGKFIEVSNIVTKLFVGIFFVAVPVIALGPIQAGFTYVIQSFIRERPVFLTFDFFKKAKSNFWQSLLVCIINIVLTALFFIAISFYKIKAVPGSSVFWTMGLAVVVIVFVVFVLMNLYIYPLLVTFNVNLKQLYKNAFFLAMTSFFKGLLVLLLDAFIIFAVYMLFLGNTQILLIMIAGLLFSTIGLINNYFGFKYIKYHLLDPILAASEQNGGEEN